VPQAKHLRVIMTLNGGGKINQCLWKRQGAVRSRVEGGGAGGGGEEGGRGREGGEVRGRREGEVRTYRDRADDLVTG